MSGARVLAGARWLVRWWTRQYTRGLPPDVATTRRQEIESDLWEHEAAFARHGRSGLRTTLSLLQRAATGLPADLLWRFRPRPVARVRRARTRRSPSMSHHPEPKPWRPLPEAHQFDQLNAVVDVTDQRTDEDLAAESDRVVARNAANIAAGVSAGGLQ